MPQTTTTRQPMPANEHAAIPSGAVRMTPLQLNRVRYPVNHTPLHPLEH